MTSKIVVTGLGATTPLGGDVKSTWAALLAGESGITTLEQEWVARHQLPVTFAGQAKVPAKEVLAHKEVKRLDPSSQFALVAAREAWADAGAPDVVPERLAVEFSTGIGGVWTLLDAYDTLNAGEARHVSPMTVPMLMPNGPAAAIGMDLAARGGVRTSVSACASSTEAIANAIARLRSGEVDMVVAGGSEAAIHPLPIGLPSRCRRRNRAMLQHSRHVRFQGDYRHGVRGCPRKPRGQARLRPRQSPMFRQSGACHPPPVEPEPLPDHQLGFLRLGLLPWSYIQPFCEG